MAAISWVILYEWMDFRSLCEAELDIRLKKWLTACLVHLFFPSSGVLHKRTTVESVRDWSGREVRIMWSAAGCAAVQSLAAQREQGPSWGQAKPSYQFLPYNVGRDSIQPFNQFQQSSSGWLWCLNRNVIEIVHFYLFFISGEAFGADG
jgi:hypothetical protein